MDQADHSRVYHADNYKDSCPHSQHKACASKALNSKPLATLNPKPLNLQSFIFRTRALSGSRLGLAGFFGVGRV